ncbi:hypothetical protein GALMADRAFT_929979 [Galerina marginata CBS 339.88]|uniref:Nephrocystin 3-like N-terminal domain-containing protein n=1 Tax=Galerina marginata (strain CBS 339.88) TaxID=685588 RepID=A0A067SH54_GALM3|nr:hypothetical protein GALMADRAFT_929979 [Galerina marginata CBS 339.88]
MSNGTPSQFQFGGDVAIMGGSFHHQTSISAIEPGFERLQKRVAASAMHDSGESFEKPKCHENTRVAVLAQLTDWILGSIEQDKPIMWLYGDAGAGKSAIVQTLALRFSSAGHLLASFAFSRNDATRATHTPLVPTIAYQIGTAVPDLRSLIGAAVERDPMLFEKSLEVQFTALVIKPINDLSSRPGFVPNSIPYLIIIDGLDECSDPRIQIRVLEVVSDAIQQCSVHLKVLIASRPQVDIKGLFDYDPLDLLSTRLALDGSFKPDNDIRLVFVEAFREIKAKHRCKRSIPSSWPGENPLRQLVSRASGQFIYVSTVVEYVSSPRHHPVERLNIILGIQPRHSDRDLPFSRLDAIYTYIFYAIPEENIEVVLNILAFNMYGFRKPYVKDLDLVFSVLSLDVSKVELYLGDLSAVLKWTTFSSGKLRELHFTHASLYDFLSDKGRSRQFHIDKPTCLSKLACFCLDRLKQRQKTR